MSILTLVLILIIIYTSFGFYAYYKYPYTKDKMYSYFLPVNDSLFENIKLIWISYMVVGMFTYGIFHNTLPLSYMFGLLVSAVIAIIIVTLFLLIVDFFTKTCLWTTVFIYFVASAVAGMANYLILMTNFQNYYIIMFSIVTSVLITACLAYFTYDNIASSIAWEEEQ